MPIDALSVLCAQLTRDLLTTAKFLLFIFPFLQTNITSQMWQSGGKGIKRGQGVKGLGLKGHKTPKT